MWYILWFCQTSGTVSPSLFEPYNLNHLSVFPVTLRLSCLPLACVSLTYPSPTPPCCTVVGLSTLMLQWGVPSTSQWLCPSSIVLDDCFHNSVSMNESPTYHAWRATLPDLLGHFPVFPDPLSICFIIGVHLKQFRVSLAHGREHL